MRFASAILIGLSAAGLTPALADPPDSTAAAASQPATPATNATPAAAPAQAAPATSQSAAPAAQAAAATPVAAAAKPAPTIDAQERQLMDLGYTPEMHNGTKLWCRREEELGSRLGSHKKVCGTAEEVALHQQQAQEQFKQEQAAGNVPASSGK
jgi:hypothetical protein